MRNNRTSGQAAGKLAYLRQAIQLVADTLTRSWPSKRPV